MPTLRSKMFQKGSYIYTVEIYATRKVALVKRFANCNLVLCSFLNREPQVHMP
jgi:hypothetical protein